MVALACQCAGRGGAHDQADAICGRMAVGDMTLYILSQYLFIGE